MGNYFFQIICVKAEYCFSFFVHRDSYKTTEEEEEEEELSADKGGAEEKGRREFENKLCLSDDANAGTQTHLVRLMTASPAGCRNK